jgi:hypothetical protein
VRIKALPLSQSKQKKRTKGVITIQRDKDSWNQRPQTSGSLTPPLTCAPRTRARLPAPDRRPRPPPGGSPSPCRTCCLVSPTPSPPLRDRTPTLTYKTPPPAPSTPILLKAKHTLDKIPLPNRKQLHFPFTCP